MRAFKDCRITHLQGVKADKKTLIAIVVSAALSAPFIAYAENDVMVGAGFGVIDVGFGSASGFMFGAQIKLNEKAGIGANYHEGDVFSVSYRGYIDKYADGLFWEAGLISGGGATGFEGGGGFDMPLRNQLSLRVGVGVLVVSGATAFAARAGVYYSF